MQLGAFQGVGLDVGVANGGVTRLGQGAVQTLAAKGYSCMEVFVRVLLGPPVVLFSVMV